MPLVRIADLTKEDADAPELYKLATQLDEMYTEFIEGPGDGKLRAPGIHASETSGCQRKVVYSLLAYDRIDKISKNWRQRFQMGHAAHGFIQRDFHAMADQSGGKILFEDEVNIAPGIGLPLADEWFINSHCDGVFTFRDYKDGPDRLRVVLEIKTEANDGYAALRAPKEAHIEQAHIYMACLDVPLTWFLYLNKNNQNNTPSIDPFLIKFDPKIWESLVERFRIAHEFAERDELPPRMESMICEFCAFSWTCKPDYLAYKRQASSKASRKLAVI